MADTYSLPESDPCYSTLEAYKAYVGDRLHDFSRAFQYQRYGEQIEQWRQCCPAKSAEAERTPPEQPDPEPLRTFTLPAHIFNPKGSCAGHLYFKGAAVPQPRGKAWFEEEQARWHKYWESHFSGMKDELHACCIKNFNDRVSGSGRWTAGGTEACVQKYSPEHQPKVAVPGAPAASKVAVAEGQSLEQQYLSCRKERGEFQQQVAQAKKEQLELQERGRQEQLASQESLRQKQHALQESVRQGEAFSKDLAVCQATAAAQKTDLAGLQQQLQQTGYIPGMAALAAFPEGSGSIELGLLAVGSLVAGFLFGWAGRRRRLARLAAGSAGALFTLLVFLAIIALLPDTGWPELLFALTTAALLMSLAALRRLARLRDRHRHAPEAAVAEEDIDLDEAEKALLKRGEDAG